MVGRPFILFRSVRGWRDTKLSVASRLSFSRFAPSPYELFQKTGDIKVLSIASRIRRTGERSRSKPQVENQTHLPLFAGRIARLGVESGFLEGLKASFATGIGNAAVLGDKCSRRSGLHAVLAHREPASASIPEYRTFAGRAAPSAAPGIRLAYELVAMNLNGTSATRPAVHPIAWTDAPKDGASIALRRKIAARMLAALSRIQGANARLAVAGIGFRAIPETVHLVDRSW
jgi:hypothetical protein